MLIAKYMRCRGVDAYLSISSYTRLQRALGIVCHHLAYAADESIRCHEGDNTAFLLITLDVC